MLFLAPPFRALFNPPPSSSPSIPTPPPSLGAERGTNSARLTRIYQHGCHLLLCRLIPSARTMGTDTEQKHVVRSSVPNNHEAKGEKGFQGGGVEENSFLHASTPDHRRAYRYCCMASKFELFASSQLHKTQGTSSVPTGPQSIPSLPFSHSSSLVWEWHDFA